jgi:hypothetical protein
MSVHNANISTKRTGMVTLLGVAAILLVAGCQSSNRLVSGKMSETCPNCKVETRLQPITGLTYTRCLCPSCKRVSTLDESTLANVERYVGGHVGDTVHVCDSCGSIIETCSICQNAG